VTVSAGPDWFKKAGVQVILTTRPNLRSDNLEMEMYSGRNVLDACFDTFEILPKVTSLYLSYPERWLNILEQRALFDRLSHYCPNLTQCVIKTHSVYIVQCVHNWCVSIVDDPSLVPEVTGTAVNQPLYIKHDPTRQPGRERQPAELFDLEAGLTAIGGSVTLKNPPPKDKP
jgi:hypothetical protein